MVNVRHTCGLNRFMKAFEGISNRMYGTKLKRKTVSGHPWRLG